MKTKEKIEHLEAVINAQQNQIKNLTRIIELQLQKIKMIERFMISLDDYVDEAGMLVKGDEQHGLLKKALKMKEGGENGSRAGK